MSIFLTSLASCADFLLKHFDHPCSLYLCIKVVMAFLQSSNILPCFQARLHAQNNHSTSLSPIFKHQLCCQCLESFLTSASLVVSLPFLSISVCRHSCLILISTSKLATMALPCISAVIKLTCLFQSPIISSLSNQSFILPPHFLRTILCLISFLTAFQNSL